MKFYIHSKRNITAFIITFVLVFLSFGSNVTASSYTIDEEWKYTSVSFGKDFSEDMIIGGIRFYSPCSVYSVLPSADNGNHSYASDVVSDADSLRTSVGDTDAVSAVKHYCYNRSNGASVSGYLYFDVPGSFTPSDKSLTVEVEFFDNSEGNFVLRYVNSETEGAFGVIKVYGSGSGKWIKQKITLDDACFNKSGSTKLADGKCDFRLERGSFGDMLAVRHVAVYTGEDKTTGRSYKNASVGNTNTQRAYFTARMWSYDSKYLMVYNSSDGYVYRYCISDDSLVALVKTGSTAFYVSPGNYMYYFDRTNKDIRRVHIETLVSEKIADMYPDSYGSPGNIHVNNNDTKLAVQVYEKDDNGNKEEFYRRIPMLDIKTGKWDLSCSYEFEEDYPLLGHVIMNPGYDNLVFFCHEGTTTEIPDRLWVMDFETGKAKNVFVQQDNSLPEGDAVKTGETSGHEEWTADGEHIVFVKYPKPKNVGMNGIVRIDKYGEKREYINDDFEYWHCFPSDDNRFVVADCMMTDSVYNENLNMKCGNCKIVLVDIKTSLSYLLADIPAGDTHPYQPHPCISPNGKLVSFSVRSADDSLNFGVMDVSDITAGARGETFEHYTNEDRGFEISSPAPVSDGSLSLTISGTRKQNNPYLLVGVRRKEGKVSAVSLAKGTISEGEKKAETVSGDEFYIWSGGLRPVKLMPTAPEKLRAVSAYSGSVRLMWFAPANLSDDNISYEVYRDGEFLSEVKDGYFCDTSAVGGCEYVYSVRAVYPGGICSPFTKLKVPVYDITITLNGNMIDGKGMDFVLNDTNPIKDSYTEYAEIGGKACRKSTLQIVDDGVTVKNKTGMFYFVLKESVMRSQSTVTVTVEYYDNGTAPLYFQYNASDGSVAKSVKLAQRTDTNQWLKASVTVNDAMFRKPKELTYSDFRLNGGADTYISSLRVDAEAKAGNAQCSEWIGGESNGLIVSDEAGNVATSGKEGDILLDAEEKLFCAIDDSFMYSDCKRGVTIEIEYCDTQSGNIYLSYGTNDITYEGDKASKTTVLTRTQGSGDYAKSRIFLADCCFVNQQSFGGDFSISTDCPVSIRGIRVIHGSV